MKISMGTLYSGRTWKTLLGGLAAAAVMAGSIASPARPQEAPPKPPPIINPISALSTGATVKEPVVFPERDFVVIENYKPTTVYEMRVVRDGALIGKATGETDGAGLLEANHPGGVCWSGVTPDILPGDVVDIVELRPANEADVIDRLVTQNVTAEAAKRDLNGTPNNPDDDKLVVEGTARTIDGKPMTDDQFRNFEQRIVAPEFRDDPATGIGGRDISVTGDGATDVPAGVTAKLVRDGADWTSTYTGLSSAAIDVAIAGQSRALSWMETGAPDAAGEAARLGITIYEEDETGGPGMGGCPLGAEYAVTGSSHSPGVNAANVGQDLVISGVSHETSAVSVTLDDEDQNTPAVTKAVDASSLRPHPDVAGAQTWEVNFSAAEVDHLKPGTLTAKGLYTIKNPDETDTARPTVQIGGTVLEMQKDLEAPGAPAADPAPTATPFLDPQSVTLTGADPKAKIYYTLNGAAPTAKSREFSARFTSPIRISTSLTLKAVAIDPAGNVSEVASLDYRVGTDPVALPPDPPLVDPEEPTPTVSAPPEAPKEPVVFPERDFVVAEGYAPNTDLTFNVKRNGVIVGSARGTTDGTGILEANHPGGVCWVGSTPDIRPNDVVEIVDPAGNKDAVDTADVSAEAAFLEGSDIVVKGTAKMKDDNGTPEDPTDDKVVPIPLDRVEQRIINPDLNDTSVGRRDIRATSDGSGLGTIAYDPVGPENPDGTEWTARYAGLDEATRTAALAGQTRVLSWMETDAAANRLGITIYEEDETGGPGMGGCPLGAVNAVAGSSHSPGVNIANIEDPATRKDLVLSGVAENAKAVTVSLTDEATGAITSVPVLPENLQAAPGPQTWWVTIPAEGVANLQDGTLTASAKYTVPNPAYVPESVPNPAYVEGGTEPQTIPNPVFVPGSTEPETIDVDGARLKILKDTERPSQPQASPGPGEYFDDAQPVTLDNPADSADPGAKIHHAIDAAPTSLTRGFVNPEPILVEKSQTINARAIDAAGNKSAIGSFRYVITDATPPAVPTAIDLAVASDTGVSSTDNITSDTTPTFSGTAEARSSVQIFDGANVVGSGTAGADGRFSITTSALAQGVRTLTVRTTDASGNVSDAATFALTVDSEAPNTTIPATSGPSGRVNVTSASFAFTSTEARSTLRCSLDGAAFAACASPRALTALAPNRAHTFRVQATDAAGNVDATPASRTWTIDTVRPTISRVTPANGTRNIVRTTNVTATLSERVTNVTRATVQLKRPNGTLVPASVTLNTAGTQLTLNPGASLAANTRYTVTTLGGANGVKDAAGNPLAANRTWSFTTR